MKLLQKIVRSLLPDHFLKKQVPPDIIQRIREQFPNEEERREAENIISGLWHTPLNVGPAQLARSMLVLVDGDLNELRIVSETFYGDPRDVIMSAEKKAGNPGHYFVPAFNEIEK